MKTGKRYDEKLPPMIYSAEYQSWHRAAKSGRKSEAEFWAAKWAKRFVREPRTRRNFWGRTVHA